MMITIHGLPISTKYHDLKVLIKQQCNISDFILDCLVNDTDGTKKVRVGLADDNEGSHFIKCLDGFRIVSTGHVLRLVPVGKSSSTTQPPNTFDSRGNYQHADYHNQNFNERNSRPLDAARPDAWANNQWSPNQPQMQMQNSYSYQQPIVTPYGQAANPLAKPQFEPREVVPLGRVPQQTQNFAYNPKSNLISLGPSNLREVPVASGRPTPPGRYPNQNYNMSSEKPITIMKDNFQGPNQYNLTSSQNNQSSNFQMPNAPSHWANQHQQQKPFEKPVASIDKKPYNDRKYPTEIKQLQETSKPDDSYRYDKSGREFSPQRRGFRDVETARRMSPSRQLTHSSRRVSPSGRQIYTDRRTSPERRISPSNRNISSSGRNFSPGRQIPPSGRHVSPSSRPSGQHVSPPGRASGRYVSPSSRPSGRQVSPPGRTSGRHVSPPGRPSNRLVSPPGRPSGRHVSPSGRPSGRQISPHGRHVGPPGRNLSSQDQPGHQSSGRYSSPGRHVPPSGRPISPPGRHISSGRHVSPPGRSVVPTGRQVSPPGRHILQTGRHSPLRRQIETERKMSPPRQLSPQRRNSPQIRQDEYIRGRRVSPPTHSTMDRRPNQSPLERDPSRPAHGRHESPRRQTRFSPSRHHGDKQAGYQDTRLSSSIKDVRPAYEPPTQASNEAIYSGGYRPNVREEAVKYQSRSDHWNEREKFPSKVDDRREGSRMQKFDIPRASEQQRPSEQESNRSRSPKRDRSPVRDRYKRHSPSPRSPRRSWALEKRRSPEIREPPPPPVWPQERVEYSQQVRPKLPERGFEKNSPVWETRETKRDDFQSSDDRRNFPERPKEIGKWKPIPESSSPPNTSSSRFEEPTITRKEFETRRDFTHDDDNRKGHRDRHEKDYRRERSDTRFKPELDAKEEVPRKRDEYSGRIEEKKKEILLKQEQLQKEIDEVYKRAVDFSKKAEIYKMGEKNNESNFDDGRHRNDRQNPKEMQRYKREPYEDDRDRGDYRRENKGQFIRGEDAKKLDSEDIKRSRSSGINLHTINLIKSKRNKAVDEISEKIMNRHGDFLSGEIKKRVMDELKWTLGRKMYDMFEDNDVSFIEMVVKFNAKHSPKDEENIFNEVMSSLPNHFRNLKRSTQDDSDIPAKSSRRSLEPSSNKDLQSGATEKNIPDWNIGMIPQTIPDINPVSMINPPMLVHPMPPYQQYVPVYQEIPQPEEEKKKDGFVLYLCKDDFQPILEFETDLLKNFLIQQLIKVTETTQGWAPDFTLNNKINSYRHEVVTRDKLSQDWLLGLDFSEFKEFNVLVYTTEELWYERAAIWLPGHSRSKNIEPLVKLKLQNKKLEGVNIGKWKTVKKIVTAKGTRLYVDMPPSSARALEKCKMLLSYELQKVNVFLKAVAIDKDAFDAGLNEASLPFIPAAASTPMPSVGEHPDLVKMALKERPPSHRDSLKKSSSSTSEKRKSTEDPKSSESKQKKNLDNDSKEKQLKEDQEEGQFQLNDLMTRMLEEELQTIMIEVWQALPDAPTTEAEKYVVDKLRNETSDRIRNVIGLNVTKRLLNVFNPLIVKLNFTCRPEKGCLTKFLKLYNIKGFKRIAEEENTFSARLASITDFDKICSEKDIQCGGAKITVTPCYKFDKFPSKLISIYNNEEEESNKEGKEGNDDENKEIESNTTNVKDSNTENEKNKNNETKIKDVSNENKEKSNLPDKKVNTIKENITTNTKDTAKVQSSTNNKVKPNNEVQKANDKTGNAKTIDHKITGAVKSVPSNKPKVEDAKKSLPEKKASTEESKKQTAKKAIETNKPNKNSSNMEKPKVSQSKRKIILEEEEHMVEEDKEVMEDEVNKFDEGDEMNDEEILALVSEGVVVDECSGSDGE